MATRINTDVLIVGSGPAGLSSALALGTYGVPSILITKHSWVAPEARAHATNQRTFEVFRDLGIEREALSKATPYTAMPNVVFCASLTGEEYGRKSSLGGGFERHGEYMTSSPCEMCDLGQDLLEPILLENALTRGANIRFNTEYLSCVQEADGVTANLRDRISGESYSVWAKYMIGADGGRSQVAADLCLPFEGKADLAVSVNIYFDCDLSRYVAHRPGVLYFIIRTVAGEQTSLGYLHPTRRWDQWVFTYAYAGQGKMELTHEEATQIIRDHLGDATLDLHIRSVVPWAQHSLHATRNTLGRVFCVGDSVHRHVPSNGLGSNTAVQDSYNLAWKLAYVLQGKAHPALLASYEPERVPVGKEVVGRATRSLEEYPPILEALGVAGAEGAEALMHLQELRAGEGAARREQLRQAIARKEFEFNAHGVEMNQRYQSAAIVSDGTQPRSWPTDPELHAHPTTWPGAKLPHAWVQKDGFALSTLDLVGKGRFTVITGIGGDVWLAAAAEAGSQIGIDVHSWQIGYGAAITDLYGTWAELREIAESGCLLVRPDGYIAWRMAEAPSDVSQASQSLHSALRQILGYTGQI